MHISEPTSATNHRLNSLLCLRGPICLPLSGFTHCFTLSSKFFSIFHHCTCSLSDSWSYLAFDGVYHRLHLVLANKATLWQPKSEQAARDTGLAPFLAWSLTQENLRQPAVRIKNRLHATAPTTVASSRIQRWAFPISLAVTVGIPVGFFSSA